MSKKDEWRFFHEYPFVTKYEFSSDPTARGDDIASYAREWYEVHRESWFERHRLGSWHRRKETADNFMLSFVAEIHKILKAANE